MKTREELIAENELLKTELTIKEKDILELIDDQRTIADRLVFEMRLNLQFKTQFIPENKKSQLISMIKAVSIGLSDFSNELVSVKNNLVYKKS